MSNLVLAPGQNGGIWVTVDMRKPIKDTHIPIIRVKVIRTQLNNCAVISKLDFKSESQLMSWLKTPDQISCKTPIQVHKTRIKRTITRAETSFYCHTATSCHTQQFDHCKDTWEETQKSPRLCFEHN